MQIKGMKRLQNKLSSLDTVSRKSLKQEMLKEGRVIQRDAKKDAPANIGDLRRSIKLESTDNEKSLSVRVFTNSPYARYVEFGTGPKGKASEKIMPDGVVISYKDKGWYIPVEKFPNYTDYGLKPVKLGDKEYIFSTGQAAQQFMTTAALKARKVSTKKINDGVVTRIRKEMVK